MVLPQSRSGRGVFWYGSCSSGSVYWVVALLRRGLLESIRLCEATEAGQSMKWWYLMCGLISIGFALIPPIWSWQSLLCASVGLYNVSRFYSYDD